MSSAKTQMFRSLFLAVLASPCAATLLDALDSSVHDHFPPMRGAVPFIADCVYLENVAEASSGDRLWSQAHSPTVTRHLLTVCGLIIAWQDHFDVARSYPFGASRRDAERDGPLLAATAPSLPRGTCGMPRSQARADARSMVSPSASSSSTSLRPPPSITTSISRLSWYA